MSLDSCRSTSNATGNYGKFSDYCMYPLYIDRAESSMATFDADCSSKKNGFHYIGTELAKSQLDFNDCFMNDDGNMVPHQGQAPHLLMTPPPNNKNKAGVTVASAMFDIATCWSARHPSPNGDTVGKFQGCNKNGAIQHIQVCST
ncbi:hypothetical protein KVR01_009782 [Diaporthe batatas]|uniref:uncharacterized protein n=1 Tax=Diaporthe batatas TaxID=748121 RepID=UPI001D04E3E4|nr:uncharacterized protein KVR01_009782 [Diaporthe batatas]KAG8160246.1 hypothetical protein KVR01_009782 [Diaporthe batatas]